MVEAKPTLQSLATSNDHDCAGMFDVSAAHHRSEANDHIMMPPFFWMHYRVFLLRHIVLRPWADIQTSHEFRAFVYGNELTGEPRSLC